MILFAFQSNRCLNQLRYLAFYIFLSDLWLVFHNQIYWCSWQAYNLNNQTCLFINNLNSFWNLLHIYIHIWNVTTTWLSNFPNLFFKLCFCLGGLNLKLKFYSLTWWVKLVISPLSSHVLFDDIYSSNILLKMVGYHVCITKSYINGWINNVLVLIIL